MPLSTRTHLVMAAVISASIGNGLAQEQTEAKIHPPRDETQWQQLPQVVMGQEQRRLLVAHDHIYVEGLPSEPSSDYALLRPGAPIATAQHGSIYLGRARLVHPGDPAVLVIEQSDREIRPGDYLLPLPPGGTTDHD